METRKQTKTLLHKKQRLKTTNLIKKHRCTEEVSSSCSTTGTRRVTLVTNPMISHERLMEVFTDIP